MRFPKYLLHACDDYYREVNAPTPIRPGIDYAQLSKRDRNRRIRFSNARKLKHLKRISAAAKRAGFTGFRACAGTMWFSKGKRRWGMNSVDRTPVEKAQGEW